MRRNIPFLVLVLVLGVGGIIKWVVEALHGGGEGSIGLHDGWEVEGDLAVGRAAEGTTTEAPADTIGAAEPTTTAAGGTWEAATGRPEAPEETATTAEGSWLAVGRAWLVVGWRPKDHPREERAGAVLLLVRGMTAVVPKGTTLATALN